MPMAPCVSALTISDRRRSLWRFYRKKLLEKVHVFDLAGHPTATRAYAWSSPIEGSTKRRFVAVLQ